ncbi:MAG: hypothetical protein IPN32_03430 [Deltaproteobacteria bacterium]|nr:hypothetical protein [Deltaproteobacteria bacterium]
MARSRAPRGRVEQQLEAVREALREREAADATAVLRKALAGSHGYTIGVIADALESDDDVLLAALPDAFARLSADPIARDAGCHGKTAIARALDRLERWHDDVLLAGVRWVQREPVWGGSADTAAQLRAVCGMALVHARSGRAMVEIALLLADAEAAPRIAAARAIAASGDRMTGEPLLRLRLALPEPEPEVTGELFAALLDLVGDEALEVVAAAMVGKDPALADAAALALGGSRMAGAFALLRDSVDTTVGPARRTRLLAIALLCDTAAWAYLLDCIRNGSTPLAQDAAHALATFRHDAELCRELQTAAALRDDDVVTDLVAHLLDVPIT